MSEAGDLKGKESLIPDAPRFADHEVTVTFNVTTTNDDLQAALRRSGLVPGELVGEALIENVETYSPGGEDD